MCILTFHSLIKSVTPNTHTEMLMLFFIEEEGQDKIYESECGFVWTCC